MGEHGDLMPGGVALRFYKWLNGVLKTALKLPDIAYDEGCESSDYLEWAHAEACHTDDYEEKQWVILLRHVTRGAGGLSDVLHLGQHLQEDHNQQVYYKIPAGMDRQEACRRIQWTHKGVEDNQVIDKPSFTPEYVCATAWPTAFEALSVPSNRKIYFVQDYEAWFRAAGTERYYAGRSYELGLEMFTLGPWLDRHLNNNHRCGRVGHMPFPMTDEPVTTAEGDRKLISFYVQPDKSHRGTELILEVARRVSREIKKNGSGMQVVLFGSADLDYMKMDFDCRVDGLLNESALKDLFSSTRVGVSGSFTNISLIPFRFVAHGARAVDFDLPNVVDNVPQRLKEYVRCFEPTVDALTAGVFELINQKEPVDMSAVQEQHAESCWGACAVSMMNFVGAGNGKE